MATVFAVTVFIAALALIVWKPKGLHEAFIALVGAALLFGARLIQPADAAYIWHFVWDATFSLIGIMLFTALLDAGGFFRWAALHIVRRFHRRKRWLFVGLSALAACITVFFNNDGTILIMVPIVLEATSLLGLTGKARMAFLLGVGLMADTASAPLMMSNLTNILTADFFSLSFGDYAGTMLLPGVTAILATIAVTIGFFGRSLAEDRETVILLNGEKSADGHAADGKSEFPEPASAIQDRRLFKLSWAIIVFMLGGYLVAGEFGVPVSFVALAGAGIQWIASAAVGKGEFRATLRRTPWLIVVFALAMNLIVYALYLNGAVDWLPRALAALTERGSFVGIVGSGGLFALLSAAVNNLPAVLVSSLAIQDGGGTDYLPYASVLGASVGAKLTPLGSLATLLWMQLLRKGGVALSWRAYLKYGLLFTPPILFLSLLVLWLELG